MNEREQKPDRPVRPSDEATIRDIMARRGISFAAAREHWELLKAATNEEVRNSKEK